MIRWRRRRLGLALAVPVVAVVVVSLGQGGARSFRLSNQLVITAPPPLTVVSTPFSISWRTGGSTSGHYAVFVDLGPIAPGHSLRDLATQECKRVRSCQPTASYLQGLGVYLTSGDEAIVVYLAPSSGVASREPHPVHTATVVELDAAGRRVGDVAWQVQFRA